MSINDLLIISPELIIIIFGLSILIIDFFKVRKSLLSIISILGLIIAILALVYQLFSDITITQSSFLNSSIVFDELGILYKSIIILSAIFVLLASTNFTKSFDKYTSEFYSLILLSTSGMMFLSSASELILLYLSIELTTLPLIALCAINKTNKSAESSMKFLILASISSAILLYGIVLLYGLTGTTDIQLITTVLTDLFKNGDTQNITISILIITLIITGFGFKISAVPFQMWTPDVYEGSPISITAFLSVASKAAAFAALIRISTLIFPNLPQEISWGDIIAIISATSMTIGNFSAILQNSFKRMMAYSTIAHAGYLLIAIAGISSGVISDSISTLSFYLIGYSLMNLTAFLSVMIVLNTNKDDSIKSLSGLGKTSPLIAFCIAISMIALTGFPPTVGFIGKLYLFSVGFNAGFTWLIFVALLNSVISAYYYLRVIKVMYFNTPSKTKLLQSDVVPKFAIVFLSFLIILLGILPNPIIEITISAAESILVLK